MSALDELIENEEAACNGETIVHPSGMNSRRGRITRAAIELSALRAENERMREALIDALRAWSFDDNQFHTHSWHTRAGWIGRHPVVIDMARTALASKEDRRG